MFRVSIFEQGTTGLIGGLNAVISFDTVCFFSTLPLQARATCSPSSQTTTASKQASPLPSVAVKSHFSVVGPEALQVHSISTFVPFTER